MERALSATEGERAPANARRDPRQIWEILCAEYLFLGLLASTTGIFLALLASWVLAVFAFKLDYTPTLWPVVAAAIVVSALTVGVGLLTSYGVGSTPPLAILRDELD